MTKREVYLDHAATTPVDPEVVAAMLPVFNDNWGNPSALYREGRKANDALETARATVAQVLNCRPAEIIFNSGGTEGDNSAIKGVALQAQLKGKGKHIITSNFEHHAVLHSVEYLEQFGFEVTFLPINRDGLIEPEAVEQAIRPDTVLISLIYANNEIGTVLPIAEISRIARARNIPFHTDAVQAAGYLPIDVQALGVDILTLSGHKFYAPKGAGIMYVRQGTPILYQQQGGSQEKRRRAGTENVPYIVGMAKALQIAEERRESAVGYVSTLRDKLWEGIQERIPDISLNGTIEEEKRLANNLNVTFGGIKGEGILQALDLQGISASNGSACNTGSAQPSHVLTALGVPEDLALGTVRFSLGKHNTSDDIDYVLEKLPLVVKRLRALFYSS
jgi:cysteine desulfurase